MTAAKFETPLTDEELAGAQSATVETLDDAERIAKAAAIIKASVAIKGTVAEAYLRGRGIDPDAIPTGCVGWHSASHAMIALGKNASGKITCCQRLFFDAAGNPRLDENRKKLRRTNGSMTGAALCIPGKGDPLVTEGVEDALSLFLATGRPVYAAFGTSKLGEVPVAAGAHVVVVRDNDAPGLKGAHKAALRLIERGCSASVATPPDGVKDSNDLLRQRDAAAVVAMVEKATAFDAEAAVDGEWPEPKALPEGLLPVASFDFQFLPGSIRPWVQDIANRMQCAAEFVAIPAMVALGAALGRKIGIRPQRHTDWIETPNLWGCIVGRPGLMKSPAQNEALKPLNRLESQARELHEAEMASFASQVEIYKLRRDEASKTARAALKEGRDASSCFDFDEPKPPVARRYVVNDTSYEALGEVLADNPNGVLAFRDELVSLLRTLDREDNAAARGFYLSAWNGTGGYSFDRITRGRKHIKAACLSLLGSTQPGRLAEYIRRATSGGAADDGLIQRFGLLVWPDQSPEWKEVDCGPDTAARQRAFATFEAFEGSDPEAFGAERDEFEAVPFLRFNDAAQAIFSEWRGELEAKLRSGDLSPALESHLAKYRKLVPSLALINHLADGGVGSVSEEALLRALAFAEYLETHARRCYAAGNEAETAAAKAILARIRKGDLQDGFTARDVHQRGWSNLSDRDAVKSGLDLLVDLDWLAASTEQTGGRPRTTYTINPRAKA